MARTHQCGKALQVAQDIQANVRLDDAAMENVNYNVDDIINTCQQNLNNPAADTPIPTTEGTAADASPTAETATPEATTTGTP